MIKVYKGKRLLLWETVKANTPRPAQTYKWHREDKERAERARRNARLVNILTK